MSKRKVLLISNSFPGVENTGSQQRTNNFFKALAKNYVVHCLIVYEREFYHVTDEQKVAFSYATTRSDVKQIVRFIPPGLKRIAFDFLTFRQQNSEVQAMGREVDKILAQQGYDVCVCRYLHNYMKVGLYRHRKSEDILLDLDDVPWKVLASQRQSFHENGIRQGLNWVSVYLIRLYCRFILRGPVKLIVSNQNDRSDRILKNADLVPNVPVEYGTVESGSTYSSKKVLCVANLQYDPNLLGVHHFAVKVWPNVLSSHPDAVLEVIGQYDVDNRQIQQINEIKGVNLPGYVHDLAKHYQECQFTIAPIYWGGGTKIKIIESLSFKKTVVTTPHSIDGYEETLRNGQTVLVGADDDDFARCCVVLLSNPDLCEQMGTDGNAIAKEVYSFSRFHDALFRTLRSNSSI